MISAEVNMYHVNDYLINKGWRMNGCQDPPGFHFCVTLHNTLPGVADNFIKDLRDGVEYAKNPAQPFPKSGALYGLSGSIEGREFLKQGMLDFIEATFREARTES
jgi:hypothetical protein